MLEAQFKTKLISKLKQQFPGCIVLHTDPTDIQGLPDLVMLYKNRWAGLEGKKELSSSCRPNQQYYVDLMNNMSFASFICPENEGEVLHDLQRSLEA